MKLQFVTTSAEACDPNSGARLYVRAAGAGAWSWRVEVPLGKGEHRSVGHGEECSEAGARGAARKCLARHLAKGKAA
jgi:hypothetical protein